MDFKELSTVGFSGTANAKNSVSWSEDDKIAILTQKGVNILDLRLSRKSSSSEIDFVRSLIVPPAGIPTYETGIKTDEVFLRAHRHQVYEMMLDPLLYTGLKITEQQSSETLQVAWSHAGMADSRGCLLALRQNTGSVLIYQRKKTNWVEILNISKMWLKHLKEKVWVAERSHDNNIYSMLKSRAHSIEATNIAWSQLVTEGSCSRSYFLVAHRDSTIVAWKLEKIGEGTASFTKVSIAFQLVVNLDRISHLSWHSNGINKALVVIGDIKGVVRTVLINDIKAVEQTPLKTHLLWEEEDHIALTNSVAFCENGTWLIAAIKGSCIVALAMTETGTHLAKTIANLGTLDISGIQYIGDVTLVLITQCGSLSKIRLLFNEERKELELECLDLPVKFDVKNFFLQGVALSRNRLIYAAVQKVLSPYDHLCLREPTELVFFTYSTFKCAWESLDSEQFSDLAQCWDYLELIRMLGKSMSWNLDLRAIEQTTHKNPNLAWWLVVMKQMEQPDEHLLKMQHRLEALILSRHACRILESANGKVMNEEEQKSFQLLRKWLRYHVSTCEPSDAALVPTHLLSQTEIEPPELCEICGAEVEFSGSSEAKCQVGHTLPRCSLSLLACSSAILRSCSTCNIVAMQNAVFDLEPKCLYCCRPFYLDEYF